MTLVRMDIPLPVCMDAKGCQNSKKKSKILKVGVQSSELLELWIFWNSKFFEYLHRRVLSKIPMTFFHQLKIQNSTRLLITQQILNFKIFSSRSSDESSVSLPKSSAEKSYNIFRSTQNPKIYTTWKIPKKFRISKFSEFQEFWWEFCFLPEEFYRKSLWRFSINSKSKNLHDWSTQKISNIEIFRVPGVLMRVLFPRRGVLQKSPITFYDQLKIQKSARLWRYPKNFELKNFLSSRTSDESSVSLLKSSVEKSYNIFRSNQNPKIYTTEYTQKFWISKLLEFQEFWWEFCLPPVEFYRKYIWHFSINSKSKNLHDFEVPKKFWISNFSEFLEFWWEFIPPRPPTPEEFCRKTL